MRARPETSARPAGPLSGGPSGGAPVCASPELASPALSPRAAWLIKRENCGSQGVLGSDRRAARRTNWIRARKH